MSTKSKLQLRISEIRTKLREIAEADDLSDELRESVEPLKIELRDSEVKLQACLLAEENQDDHVDTSSPVDQETRERLELRSKVKISDILRGVERGRVSPEIREYQSACNAGSDEIPFDLFEIEERAVTPAPASGTGVNVQRIVPAVFAMSAAGMLGIQMPRVQSGTPSWLRITTNQSAGFKSKGADATATAGALTPISTTPHRLSARLEITIEAAAEVGIGTFEAMLRSNLMMVLSDTLDKSLLRGDGSGDTIEGIISEVGAPTAESTTDTWALARAKMVALTDGIWARSLKDVSLMAGVDTMQHFDGLYPLAASNEVYPRQSLSENLKGILMDYQSSANMPAAASNVQTAIYCRKGRPSEQLAVCPRWSEISITDIYSGSASGTTSYSLHVLIGDVLILQPSAYGTLSFKLA